MPRIQKPPIGLMPLKFWREYHPHPTIGQRIQRAIDLTLAIGRYKLAGRSIPVNWTRTSED